MVWSSTSPDGTKSVKTNTAPMAANTSYIETTQNNDHYWNIGVNEDGHHKSVQMKNFINSAVGAPANAPIAAGMDACTYLRTVSASDTRIQGFFRNAQGIYQFIPSFLTGSIAIPSDAAFTNIVTIPNDCYGHVYMFRSGNSESMTFGFFKCSGSVCQTYSAMTRFDSATTIVTNLLFGNGTNASGQNLRARRSAGGNHIYEYRIVYWAM